MFRHCGKRVGMLCLLLDVLKGFIPVFLASLFMKTDGVLFTLVMIAPVLGHAAGVFNRFHGGKCIAVSFGVMFGILPVTWIGIAVLAGLYVLFSAVTIIRSNRVRSIIVYTLYGLITGVVLGFGGFASVAAGCAVIALIAVIKHLKVVEAVAEGRLSKNEK